MTQQPRVVLGRVLLRARDNVNRSPEQVGALVSVSGRTVRRLEAGEADKPRRVTLEALAGFYGLNPDVVTEISEFAPTEGEGLLAHLRQQVAKILGVAVVTALEGMDEEAVELAMRLARLGGSRADGLSPERGRTQFVMSYLRSGNTRAPREHTEVVQAFTDFLALDRSRRTVVRQILNDLRRAQESEGPD